MHLLYCDETNLDKKDGNFFVYGGLVMSSDAAIALTEEIEQLRKSAAIEPAFPLKFNPGPKHLDHFAFAQLKQAVIEAAIRCKCLLFASMILHNIATSPEDARRNAINQLSYNFHQLLEAEKQHGIVLIDRFSDSKIDSHLREKFSTGVTGLPFSPEVRLRRILGFHNAAIGQSHFGSAIDIVLGTLRFAVNAYSQKDACKSERSEQFLRLLSPLFQKTQYVGEHGPWTTKLSLDFTPKKILSPLYKQQYRGLRIHLAKHGIIAEQDIV